MHIYRALAAAAAAASLCMLGTGLTASTAHAQTIVQTCFSASSFTLSPGLTDQDQSDVTLSGTGLLNTCVPPGISATYTLSGAVSGSCLEATVNLTQDITWSNNSTSTVDLMGSVDLGSGDFGGVVTSGLFDGDTVIFPNVLLQSLVANPLACLSPGGLTSGTGSGEEVFTSL